MQACFSLPTYQSLPSSPPDAFKATRMFWDALRSTFLNCRGVLVAYGARRVQGAVDGQRHAWADGNPAQAYTRGTRAAHALLRAERHPH
eukprot:979214-Pleurochrysis_carterae.AAC.2